MILLTASIYILLPEKVKIHIYKTRTVVSVYDGSKYEPTAYEYTRIFDGSKLMRAKNRELYYINGTPPIYTYKTISITETINYTNYSTNVTALRNVSVSIASTPTTIYRNATFKDNIGVDDIYTFDGYLGDVSSVPLSHQACFTNAQGKIFEYYIYDLENTFDKTFEIESPFSFGKQMKAEWQDGSYLSKYYNYKTVPNKIKVRYKIPDDYECYSVRLFDPPLEYGYINGSNYGALIPGINLTIQYDTEYGAKTCVDAGASDKGNYSKWVANYGNVDTTIPTITDMIDGFLPDAVNNAVFFVQVTSGNLPCEFNMTIDLGNNTEINFTINQTILHATGKFGTFGSIVTIFNSTTSQTFSNASLITGTWENITSAEFTAFQVADEFVELAINFTNITTRYLRLHFNLNSVGFEGSAIFNIEEIQVFGFREPAPPPPPPSPISFNFTFDSCYDNVSLGGCFAINWAIPYNQINWSDNGTVERGGNFSWNFTETGIQPLNKWLFNVTYHNLTKNGTLRIKLNQTSRNWTLRYNQTNLSSTEYVSFLNITNGTSVLINFTLDILNFNQSYINWGLVYSNADWSFNYTLNMIENTG